ncbi:MAG: hypothetical protein ACKOZY_01305 [Flavobacteriales bacterium]
MKTKSISPEFVRALAAIALTVIVFAFSSCSSSQGMSYNAHLKRKFDCSKDGGCSWHR